MVRTVLDQKVRSFSDDGEGWSHSQEHFEEIYRSVTFDLPNLAHWTRGGILGREPKRRLSESLSQKCQCYVGKRHVPRLFGVFLASEPEGVFWGYLITGITEVTWAGSMVHTGAAVRAAARVRRPGRTNRSSRNNNPIHLSGRRAKREFQQ